MTRQKNKAEYRDERAADPEDEWDVRRSRTDVRRRSGNTGNHRRGRRRNRQKARIRFLASMLGTLLGAILLVLVAYWISLPLLVVGLFFGCKYRFSGPDLDKNRVGEVVNQVSAKVGDAVGQVRDEFKREFDKSRGKKGK